MNHGDVAGRLPYLADPKKSRRRQVAESCGTLFGAYCRSLVYLVYLYESGSRPREDQIMNHIPDFELDRVEADLGLLQQRWETEGIPGRVRRIL